MIPTVAPLRRNSPSRAETNVRTIKIGHFLLQTASRAGRAELAELTEPAEVPEPAELAELTELSGPRELKRGKHNRKSTFFGRDRS